MKESAFENVVWKMAIILSRERWVKCQSCTYTRPTLCHLCTSKCPRTKQSLAITRPWWRHQMETFSALLALCAGNSPVTGEFPAQMPVMRSFDVFFDLLLNKWLSKQWIQDRFTDQWHHSKWLSKPHEISLQSVNSCSWLYNILPLPLLTFSNLLKSLDKILTINIHYHI